MELSTKKAKLLGNMLKFTNIWNWLVNPELYVTNEVECFPYWDCPQDDDVTIVWTMF